MMEAAPSFVQLKFFIPDSAVGRAVGKQGSNVSAVRETTKAKVHVSSDDGSNTTVTEGEVPAGFREITIIGNGATCQLAAQLLMSYAFADRAQDQIYSQPTDIVIHVVEEPAVTVWEYVTTIGNFPCSLGGRYVQVQGLPHMLMACLCGVGSSGPAQDLPVRAGSGGPRLGLPAGTKRPLDAAYGTAPVKQPRHSMADASGPQTTETVPLAQDRIGRVIGKGGSGLKLIREASGCKLDVSSSENKAVLSGSPDQVSIGKCLLHMKSAEIYPSHTEAGKQLFEFYVPHSIAGRIIGKGGDMLKQCRLNHGAKVEVAPQGTQVDSSNRPIPPHVRFVAISSDSADSVRSCLDFLVEQIHGAMSGLQPARRPAGAPAMGSPMGHPGNVTPVYHQALGGYPSFGMV